MAHTRLHPGLCSAAGIAAAFIVAACAGAPAPVTAPQTAVRLDPVSGGSTQPSTAPLPALPAISGGGAIAERPHRVKELAVTNQPVGVVVRELAEQFGLQYSIAPGVSGRVHTVLRNKTLTERVAMVLDANRCMRPRIEGHLRTLHPEWSDEEIQAEIARRMLGGASGPPATRD